MRAGSNDGVVTATASPLSHTLSSHSHTFFKKKGNISTTIVAQQSALWLTKAISPHLTADSKKCTNNKLFGSHTFTILLLVNAERILNVTVIVIVWLIDDTTKKKKSLFYFLM